MTCEKCIHFDICNENADGNIVELMKEPCFRFKDKDSLVEVVRCEKCKQSERMSSPYGTVVHCHRWNRDVDYDGFCHEGY